MPAAAKAPRWWRTRKDPFAEGWQSECRPQLVVHTGGRLQVLRLFTALCRRHQGRFQPGQLGTLQRRVREWRVQYGPDREVYFDQVAVAGSETTFDFTEASDPGWTLRGVAFPRFGDQVSLKRFWRIDDRQVELRPESHNPKHEVIKLDLAKVVGVLRGGGVGVRF